MSDMSKSLIVVINLLNRSCYGCLCLLSQILLGSPLGILEAESGRSEEYSSEVREKPDL